jgi:hypothetical protein
MKIIHLEGISVTEGVVDKTIKFWIQEPLYYR